MDILNTFQQHSPNHVFEFRTRWQKTTLEHKSDDIKSTAMHIPTERVHVCVYECVCVYLPVSLFICA